MRRLLLTLPLLLLALAAALFHLRARADPIDLPLLTRVDTRYSLHASDAGLGLQRRHHTTLTLAPATLPSLAALFASSPLFTTGGTVHVSGTFSITPPSSSAPPSSSGALSSSGAPSSAPSVAGAPTVTTLTLRDLTFTIPASTSAPALPPPTTAPPGALFTGVGSMLLTPTPLRRSFLGFSATHAPVSTTSFGPTATVTTTTLTSTYRAPYYAFYAMALPFLLAVALALRSHLRQHHRRRHHLCLTCGYDLRAHLGGAAGTQCPECGTPLAILSARPA